MFRIIILLMSMLLLIEGCSAEYPNDLYVNATVSRQVEITKDYFGMHFHRLALSPGENKPLTKWPDNLVGTIRLWDSRTRWADINPGAGQWKFERMDFFVDQATKNQAPILYVLGSTPRWMSARPDEVCPYGLGCAAEPVRIAHWEEYVRRVAKRYHGKISAYELWNEPFFSDLKSQKGRSDFFYGPVSTMVEMARVARKVLDEVDPKVILTTPGFTGNTNQLELFLSSGGKQYIQVVAYHFYSADIDQFARQVSEVRAIMKRQGVENLPLWNTETGLEVYPSDQPLPAGAQSWSRTEAASRMAQFLVFGAAAGLERYYYYSWDGERSGMVTSEGARQPAWDAYTTVQSWLLNATLLGCWALPPNGVVCKGERDGKYFLIVFAKKEGMHVVPISSDQNIVSIDKLFTATPQSIQVKNRSLQLMLGSEPMRILLGSKP